MDTQIKINGSVEPYVGPRDLAPVLGVGHEIFSDWAAKYPDFPHIDLPGTIRMRPNEVAKWLERFRGVPKHSRKAVQR